MRNWALILPPLLILLLASCGSGGLPPGANGPAPVPVIVNVTPVAVNVALGGQYQFSATVGGTTNQAVQWSVLGSPQTGTITANGLYTAPAVMPPSTSVKVEAAASADPSSTDFGTVYLVIPPPPSAFPIPVEVTTQAGWQAGNTPVSSGIPLKEGVVSNVNTLRIQTGGGGAVDAQFEVLSRWGDGSIRWLLCDFMADTSGGTGSYRLNDGGTGNATGTSLSVASTISDIVVNTGPLSFTISKSGFRLFESIKIDRDNDTAVDDECLNTAMLKGIFLRDGPTEFTMDHFTPTRLTVEQSGPIRATIVVEGTHRSSPASPEALRYVVRVTAWNNLPFIKVSYSMKNMQNHGQPALTDAAAAAQLASHADFDEVALELPIAFGGAPDVLIGGDVTNHFAGALGAGQFVELFQSYSGTYDAADPENPQPPGYNAGSGDGSSDPLTNSWATGDANSIDYTVGGSVTGSGGHAPGWIQVAAIDGNGDPLRFTAVVRKFWQQYPKSLSADGDGKVKIGLWPSAAWRLQVFEGVMKTHEVLLSFERTITLSNLVGVSRSNLLNDPAFARTGPLYNSETRAFGDIGYTNQVLADTSAFPGFQAVVSGYLARLQAHEADILADRSDGNGAAVGHEYGFWHYGDGKADQAAVGWENQNWAASRAALLWFAASGRMSLLRFGEDSIRHFRDVVVLHSDVGKRFSYAEPGNPAVVGGLCSQLGKTRYVPNNKQHDLGNFHFGDNHLDVFKGAFLAEHYVLTGDRLSLDVLAEINTYLRGSWKRHFDVANGGVDMTIDAPTTWISNGLMIATAYHMVLGAQDPNALAMANFALARALDRQTTVTPNDPTGAGFADSTGFFRAWEVGHMFEALEYTRWIMDKPSLDANLLNAANWIHGSAANVYLGLLSTPVAGAYGETPGVATDYGGDNLLIGACFVGALRASGASGWRLSAQELLAEQDGNISLANLGDAGLTHGSFARFFRAGPALLGTLRQ